MLCVTHLVQTVLQAEGQGAAKVSAVDLFDAVDKDSSGFVDHAEMRGHVTAHLVSQGTAPTSEVAEGMAAQLFQTIDVDGDGRITAAEWVRAFAASQAQQQAGRGDQPFQAVPSSKEGDGGGSPEGDEILAEDVADDEELAEASNNSSKPAPTPSSTTSAGKKKKKKAKKAKEEVQQAMAAGWGAPSSPEGMSLPGSNRCPVSSDVCYC